MSRTALTTALLLPLLPLALASGNKGPVITPAPRLMPRHVGLADKAAARGADHAVGKRDSSDPYFIGYEVPGADEWTCNFDFFTTSAGFAGCGEPLTECVDGTVANAFTTSACGVGSCFSHTIWPDPEATTPYAIFVDCDPVEYTWVRETTAVAGGGSGDEDDDDDVITESEDVSFPSQTPDPTDDDDDEDSPTFAFPTPTGDDGDDEDEDDTDNDDDDDDDTPNVPIIPGQEQGEDEDEDDAGSHVVPAAAALLVPLLLAIAL